MFLYKLDQKKYSINWEIIIRFTGQLRITTISVGISDCCYAQWFWQCRSCFAENSKRTTNQSRTFSPKTS